MTIDLINALENGLLFPDPISVSHNNSINSTNAVARDVLKPESQIYWLIGSSTAGRGFRALFRAALIVGLTAALATTPPGWAIGGGAALLWVVVDYVAQKKLHKKGVYSAQDLLKIKQIYQDPTNKADFKKAQKHSKTVSLAQVKAFKISAWQRLNGKRGDNFHVVGKTKNGGDIYLSSLPNKNDPAFKELLKSGKIGAIITINEKWEVENIIGDSSPYSSEEYENLDIKHAFIPFLDHAEINDDVLNTVADKVQTFDQNFNTDSNKPKKAILIHCRAGVGRSSQGVASYLIKHQKMSAKDAADQIRDGSKAHNIPGRPQATIHKKFNAISRFEKYCAMSLS